MLSDFSPKRLPEVGKTAADCFLRMALGLLAASQFLLLVGMGRREFLMAAQAGLVLEFLTVDSAVITMHTLVFAVQIVMAACGGTFLEIFFVVHKVVTFHAFDILVTAVIEDDTFFHQIHFQTVGRDGGLHGQRGDGQSQKKEAQSAQDKIPHENPPSKEIIRFLL